MIMMMMMMMMMCGGGDDDEHEKYGVNDEKDDDEGDDDDPFSNGFLCFSNNAKKIANYFDIQNCKLPSIFAVLIIFLL